MKRILVKTCTLTAGYFPDRFAAEGRAPDVFFIAESIPLSLVQEWEGPEELLWVEVVREQAELIGEAVVDKYKRRHGVPWEDLFWSVRIEVGKRDPEPVV